MHIFHFEKLHLPEMVGKLIARACDTVITQR